MSVGPVCSKGSEVETSTHYTLENCKSAFRMPALDGNRQAFQIYPA